MTRITTCSICHGPDKSTISLISTTLSHSSLHNTSDTTLHLHRLDLASREHYTMYRKLAYSIGMVALMAGPYILVE